MESVKPFLGFQATVSYFLSFEFDEASTYFYHAVRQDFGIMLNDLHIDTFRIDGSRLCPELLVNQLRRTEMNFQIIQWFSHVQFSPASCRF